MVMHSISNHDLNLPTQKEVQNYLNSLQESKVQQGGAVCTEPVAVTINKARAGGIII